MDLNTQALGRKASMMAMAFMSQRLRLLMMECGNRECTMAKEPSPGRTAPTTPGTGSTARKPASASMSVSAARPLKATG